MSYNIGPKIGIDGEKEFRDSIRKINDAYKALDAETRALTASFDAQGDEQGKLEAVSKQLQKQIEKQKEKQALLDDAVKKATAQFGEESIEATRLRGALYDTQATVSKLENELKDTTSQLDGVGDSMEDLAEEADDAGDSVLSFGDVLKANLASGAILDVLQDVGEAVKDIAEEAIESASDIRAASAQFEQAFGDMKDTAKDSLEAISDETKIAATRMQESYTNTFAFTKSVGADSEKALSMSIRAMRAAADSAAYYDRTIEEATETLQAFMKGNFANDAALGIAATETTRNAKANELYAKSFKELSEAQKVDVLLSMVEAGNAASGALGSAAREAGEWTNVNGELSESWRQFLGVIGDPLLDAVIPAIQGVTDGLKQITEELSTVSAPDALAVSMKDFEKSIKDANDQFTKTEDEIYAAAFAAEHYADRLAELEEAGLDNAVAQQEYALVVEELNKLVPDLNLTIDEQTGVVNKNIAAIRGDIAAWQEYATATAMQEKFSEVLRAQGSAKADLITAQAKLNMLVTEGELLEKRYADSISALDAAQNELNAAQREHDSLLNTTSAGWLEATDRLDAAKANVQALTEESARLGIAVDDNHIAQNKLNREIGDAEKTLESYSEEVALAEEANKLYSQSLEDSNDALTETESAIEEIRQAYADAKEESLDSINSQIGLFEELTLKSDYSASKILENWEKQQQAFLGYRDNLQKAVDMGLDEALVQQLSDGSQQSMMILDALVNDTEISIDEINAAFGDLSESKDSLASTLGQMSEGLSGVVEGFNAAEESINLYTDATKENTGVQDEQQKALRELDKSLAIVRQAYADAKEESLDSINSQIGLFEELTLKSDYSASNILENWQNQQTAFSEYQDNLQKAVDMGLDEALVQQLSDGSQESMSILDALVNDTDINIDEINAAFSKLSESKDSLASTMGQIKVTASEELSEMVNAFTSSGINAMDGLILGVTSRQDAFASSMARIGMLGQAAFNEELEINSPARKMIPSGEFTVDGAIVGVENRTKAFQETMSDLALAGENAYLTAQLDRVGSYPSIVQAPAAYSRSVAHNYGGINIAIHQQPGESGEDLAYRVMEIIQQEVEAKEAGIGA